MKRIFMSWEQCNIVVYNQTMILSARSLKEWSSGVATLTFWQEKYFRVSTYITQEIW
jgi:hypothetical protein